VSNARGGLIEVFTLPHQFLVESSGILRIPRNPRNEPEFENLRIFIKFSCVIPGSFLVHSWFAVSTSGMGRNIPQESIRTDRVIPGHSLLLLY
jgi:hypothetical protein